MTLKRLLSDPDWTEHRLVTALRRAGLKNTRQGTVNRIKNRTRNAGIGFALAIEAATDGAVTAEELPLSRETRAALRRIRDGQAGQGGAA